MVVAEEQSDSTDLTSTYNELKQKFPKNVALNCALCIHNIRPAFMIDNNFHEKTYMRKNLHVWIHDWDPKTYMRTIIREHENIQGFVYYRDFVDQPIAILWNSTNVIVHQIATLLKNKIINEVISDTNLAPIIGFLLGLTCNPSNYGRPSHERCRIVLQVDSLEFKAQMCSKQSEILDAITKFKNDINAYQPYCSDEIKLSFGCMKEAGQDEETAKHYLRTQEQNEQRDLRRQKRLRQS